METKNLLLKACSGRKSVLDKAYHNHITYLKNTFDEETEDRWEIYNLIVTEFINQGNTEYFKELKYRITDGEDPNKILLELIDREPSNVGSMGWFFRVRLEEYIEEDFIKRFFL